MATAQSPSAFLPFIDGTLLKAGNFNASRIYNYQAKTAKLCELIALFMMVSKIYIFMGVGKPDFRKGQVEK